MWMKLLCELLTCSLVRGREPFALIAWSTPPLWWCVVSAFVVMGMRRLECSRRNPTDGINMLYCYVGTVQKLDRELFCHFHFCPFEMKSKILLLDGAAPINQSRMHIILSLHILLDTPSNSCGLLPPIRRPASKPPASSWLAEEEAWQC